MTNFKISLIDSTNWRNHGAWRVEPNSPEIECALDAMRMWSNPSDLVQFALDGHGYSNSDIGHGVTYGADMDEYDPQVDELQIPDKHVQVYRFFGREGEGNEFNIEEMIYLEVLCQFLQCLGMAQEADRIRDWMDP